MTGEFIEVVNEFDNICTTESSFFPPRVNGDELWVQCHRLCLHRDHPLGLREGLYEIEGLECYLIFGTVVRSVRSIVPYSKDPSTGTIEWLDERTIVDVQRDDLVGKVAYHTFVLEGGLVEPPAWIGEWTVEAVEFKVRLYGVSRLDGSGRGDNGDRSIY